MNRKIILYIVFSLFFLNLYSEDKICTTESSIYKEELSKKIENIENVNDNNEVYTEEKVREILMKNPKVNKVEKINVKGNKIEIEGLYIRKIRISRIYTDLNMKFSEVIITKEDMEESIKKKNKDVKTIELTIKENYLIAKGEAELMGMLNSMHLEGSFYINKNKEIYYSLEKAKVKKIIPVPKGILEKFDKKINPFFKLDDLGIPLYLSRLQFEKERIIVR